MDRESSMLNDMSDREKQIPYDLIICVILKNKHKKPPNKHIDTENRWLTGEDWGEGSERNWWRRVKNYKFPTIK